MKYLMFTLFFIVSVASEATIKIAVLDTGFDTKSTWEDAHLFGLVKPKLCDNGHFSLKPNNGVIYSYNESSDIADNHGHGTHVAGLIAAELKDADYCLVIIKVFLQPKRDSKLDTAYAIGRAVEMGVKIINYSGGGYGREEKECEAVKSALDKGVKFVAAAGNDRQDLSVSPFYPAMCDDRIEVVANVNPTGVLHKTSNYGTMKNIVKEEGVKKSLLPNNLYGTMTGTSQAAAVRTGKIAKGLK